MAEKQNFHILFFYLIFLYLTLHILLYLYLQGCHIFSGHYLLCKVISKVIHKSLWWDLCQYWMWWIYRDLTSRNFVAKQWDKCSGYCVINFMTKYVINDLEIPYLPDHRLKNVRNVAMQHHPKYSKVTLSPIHWSLFKPALDKCWKIWAHSIQTRCHSC